MTIYVVISPDQQNDALAAAITREFPGSMHHDLGPSQYLVFGEGSSVEIGKRLGVSEGQLGRVLVCATVGQGGWHRRSLWEWIDSKAAEAP